uniref:Sphingomyelin phosphodiesterase n=1 Tax=Clytia hemisphaerica TaxID=252671 RepID=A0A7M5V677_9CNID
MKILLALFIFVNLISLSLQIPIKKDHNLHTFKSIFQNLGAHSSTGCTICKGLVEILHGVGSTGLGEGELINIATKICLKAKIEDNNVCNSVTREFADELWYVLMDAALQPEKICGWIFGDSCLHYVDYFPSWNITIPPRTRPATNSWKTQKSNVNPKKILHFSDTHIDFDYLQGSNAVCNEPLCCRPVNGKAGPNDTAAPKWGFPGNCDANPLLVNNLFNHIALAHEDAEYIYWTGDVPAHNVWNQSREDQIFTVKQATKLLVQYFPHKKVFPALGNHEGAPVNSFPPPYITGQQSLSWLLDTLAEDWTTWLPKDTEETIRRGGFYTVLVEEGFRVISLNMNYGNDGNWWLWINSTDPAGQLQWLADTLYKAEQNNEKVHILGHIPPSGTLLWFRFNYYRIVDRFHDTIAAQFFGHTHHDEFSLFYHSEDTEVPNNIAYIGPSVTTYNNMNPGYRTYDVDGPSTNATWNVINHDTFYAEIQKTDDTHPPEWLHEYNVKEAYGMKDLSPGEWHGLIQRMYNDPELFQIMFKAYRKQYKYDTCDTLKCRRSFLCGMMDGPFKSCDLSAEEYVIFERFRAQASTNC